MLSHRFMRAVGGSAVPSRTALRAFATTSQQCHNPGISNVSATTDSVESFNKKQREFREQLAEQQKQREASAWEHKKNLPSIDTNSPAEAQNLGSLTATGQKAEVSDPPRKAGPLTNLIYGTKEGRELDAQLEASFSQVLARGKYVHTISFHEVKLDKLEEYMELVGHWYPKMASLPENKVHLVGSWRTEVGDTNTFGMLAHVSPYIVCTYLD